METKIRHAQKKILKILSRHTKTFALSEGSALELYYLHHRFSRDLDFFSAAYNIKEIKNVVSTFEQGMGQHLTLEGEFTTPGHARVHFYTMPVKGSHLPLKIDFVEDIIFENPKIRRFDGIPVYDVRDIYRQKIFAITGLRLREDITGRQITTGRMVSRDTFDLYMLSKKICPLHKFLYKLPREQQRGMIQWYRSFSRQDLKIELLDLDIYDKKFNASEMLRYLDNEVKKFFTEVME